MSTPGPPGSGRGRILVALLLLAIGIGAGGAKALQGADLGRPSARQVAVVTSPGSTDVALAPGRYRASVGGDGSCAAADVGTGAPLTAARGAGDTVRFAVTSPATYRFSCFGSRRQVPIAPDPVATGVRVLGLDGANLLQGVVLAVTSAALAAFVAATGIARMRRRRASTEPTVTP